MALGWLVAVGVVLVLAGAGLLAFDTLRRRQPPARIPVPGEATNLIDDPAAQPTLATSTAIGSPPGLRSHLASFTSRFTRLLRPRSLAVLFTLSLLTLACVAVVIATQAMKPALPPGTVIIGLARWSGQSARVADGLAADIARAAGVGGVHNLIIRTSAAQPSSAAEAETERARLGADMLWWGSADSRWLTASLVLAANYPVGQQPWQRYTDLDAAAALLPTDAQLHLPSSTGTDPLVPLSLSLVYLAQGSYKSGTDAAYGASATISDAGGSESIAPLVQAVSEIAGGESKDVVKLLSQQEASGDMPPEAYVDRALARLELSDYPGAEADANRALADRTASNRTLARAYLARARARYRTGEVLQPALADINESLRLEPTFAPARLDKAEVLYRQSQPDPARAELGSLLQAAPDAAPAHRLLGLVYLMLGQPDQALGPLGRAGSIYSGWISGLRQDEAQAQVTGDAERAQQDQEGILHLNKELATAYMYQGMAWSDKARSEPPESFLGGVWRNIRGEPTTYERAISSLEQADKLDPNRADIVIQLGNVYVRMGDAARGADALDRAKQIAPNDPEPYLALAHLQESQNDPAGAIKTLNDLVAHAPGYYSAYEEIYRIYSGLGKSEEAQGALQQALGRPASTPEDHLWRGKFYRLLGGTDHAMAEFQAALANPDLWEAHLNLGQLFQATGQNPEALAQYNAVLAAQPNNPDALLGAGQLSALAGDGKEAEKLLQRLTAMAPANVDGHLAYLQLLLARGDTDRALNEGKQAVAADGGRADAHFLLGEVYDARGEWAAAADQYRAAVERDPGNFEALLGLARALMSQDNYAEVINVAETAIKLRKEDPQPYRWKAEAQLALGDATGALQTLGPALQQSPGYADGLAVASRAYLAEGNVTAALQMAAQASDAEPANPVGPLGTGDAQLQAGHATEALHAFDMALQRAPGSAPALTGEGRAYATLGDSARALDFFSQASGADPHYAEAHLYAGDTDVQMGKWDSAFAEYSKAVQLRPTWPQALYRLGRANLQREDLGTALALFQKATAALPGYAEAWSGLGIAYRNLGRQQDAIAAFNKATGLNPDMADAWLNLGLTYEELGQRGAAADAFSKAIEHANDQATRAQAESGLARVK